ncbi:hypothetical protein PR202_gb21929 [Eleusine coracana subsp. coracana]|uniref:RRM domain-containing protein n=1 Tax=Eleusine coracana subsp. coracana TaxID=191504 RepID=A0AAV5FFA2_ELECO|nr:hypothetical protein PR202_gb21929 [Eleusine coracana subsp. coracana]
MAEPSDRDQFTDEEEEYNLEEEMDDQDLGSEDDEEGVGGGKRLREIVRAPGKRGVCYLSRVPPHMNPSHIRQMLSKYGEVLRIYLVPEGQGHRKHASVKAKAYSEGWIEFAKKSVAKRVANMLNGEQIAEKTHIREQKLTLEIAAAKKQRDHYLSNVEKSRALKHIQERRKKKQKQKTEGTEPSNALEMKTDRPFPQKKPVGETGAKSKPNLSKDILAGVFGSSS